MGFYSQRISGDAVVIYVGRLYSKEPNIINTHMQMQEYFTSNEPFGRSLFDGMMDILNNADWREIYQARKILKGKNEKTKRTSDIDTFDGL